MAPSGTAVPRRHHSAAAAVAALTPAVYLPYLVAVQQFEHSGVIVQSWVEVASFALVVSIVGVLALLAWRWRLRATVGVTVLALAAWPWLTTARPVWNLGYVYVLFVAVALAFTAEAAVRQPHRVAALLDRPAVSVGLAHVFVAFLLQWTVRPVSVSSQLVVVSMWVVIYAVVALILFATGALPVVLWRRKRLVAPALAAVGWFVWGVYGIWTWRDSLPLTPFTATKWTALEPAPDYALQSSTLLLVLLVVAGVEYALREAVRADGRHRTVEEG